MKTHTSFLLNGDQEVINPARAEDVQALVPVLQSLLPPIQALGTQTTLSAVLAALQPLATQATAAALLAAVQALLRPCTGLVQASLDLSAPLANQVVNLGGLTEIHEVLVRKLTGTLSLRFGGAAASAIEVAQGELRSNLLVPGLLAVSPGGGGTAQLELRGR